MTESEPRRWWEDQGQPITEVRQDPDVPGGVILAPTQEGNATWSLPSDAGSFTVELQPSFHLVLAGEPFDGAIGVIVSGHHSHLSLALASQAPSDFDLDLIVTGRAGTGRYSFAVSVLGSRANPIRHLHVDAGTVTTDIPMAEISLHNAGYTCKDQQTPSGMPRIVADGNCTVDVDPEFEFEVAASSRLSVLGQSNIGILRAGKDVVISLGPSNPPSTGLVLCSLGRSESPVQIKANDGEVQIRNLAVSIEIVGGTVVVMPNARVVGLALTCGPATPTVSLHALGVAEQVTGVARLSDCRQARLAGGVDEPLPIESPAGDAGRWAEAIISGVRVPEGLQGVPVLLAARAASFFDPDVRDLPAHRDPYKRRLRWRVLRRKSDANDFAADSSHADLLAEVTAERSTQGSVRTRAAHAAYRMHQLAASSRWERWLLAAYRPFGYAQRPGPPLVVWMLLTAAAVPLVQISGKIDPSGVMDWLELLGEVVFLPFSFLRLNEGVGAELRQLPVVLLVGLRVALTVPFIFTVLAVRQFVRIGGS